MLWPLVLLPLIPTVARFILACHPSLINLRRRDNYAIVPFSPNELSIADVVLVVILFIARSAGRALGFGSGPAASTTNASNDEDGKKYRVASRAVKGDASETQSHEHHDERNLLSLPPLQLAMPLRIRPLDLDLYHKAIAPSTSSSFSKSQTTISSSILSKKAHIFLFLSAISEPALLLLLARRSCPIEPLGSVNVRNRFEILDLRLCRRIIELVSPPPDAERESRDVNENELELSILSMLPPTSRRVKRGVETDVTVSIYARQRSKHDARQWEDENVECFRQEFTILQFITSSSPSVSTPSSKSPPPPSQTQSSKPSKLQLIDTLPSHLSNPPSLATYIPLSPHDPLLWAKLCKDYNPIHISSLAARAFGFKGVIAHGNHVVARAIAALRSGLGDEYEDKDDNGESKDGEMEKQRKWWMEVNFKRPVVLPCEVGVRETSFENDNDDDGEVVGAGKDSRPKRKEGRHRTKRLEVFAGDKVFIEFAMGHHDRKSL